ncbi:Uu.00g043780.m01.CDS01 [Anthostomella pinea]|uniref:Uu.00g043780.m01.CDS01 n=1 Tax=Anthostomella pinea TaxID=933095 RepID=A0AAI8YE85_9PEZI|nr:Uu.00g043780.m01.CDS01 [Anthostomella pinea]
MRHDHTSVRGYFEREQLGLKRICTTWIATKLSDVLSSVHKGWYGGEIEHQRLDSTVENRTEMKFIVEAPEVDRTFQLGTSYTIDVDVVASDVAPESTFQPDDNTGSRVTLDLAKAWLESCETSHAACRSMRVAQWRPSRLLHWPSIPAFQDHLSVHEGEREEYDSNVRYLTLSHRWIAEKEMLLQRANMDELRHGVRFEGLKASIRDAIKVANHLGYTYLWVDTLCIVQNDPKDLALQISQMDKVYRNSACNIAAADAKDEHEGCFFDRGRSAVQTFRVYWECRALEASEARPEGFVTREILSLGLSSIFQNSGQFLGAQKPFDQWEAWSNVVQEFSSRGLTFQEDKLYALAGVSALWQTMFSDQHLAGHWRSMLPLDLLWGTARGAPTRRIAREQSVAPSWSWASVDGKVSLPAQKWFQPEVPACTGECLVTLVATVGHKDAVGNRNVGGESAALRPHKDIVLRLQGQVAQAKWTRIVGEDDKPGFQLVPHQAVHDTTSTAYTKPGGLAYWTSLSFDDDTQPLPEIIHFIAIMKGFPLYPGYSATNGLILTPAADDDDIRLIRIGRFTLVDPGYDDLEPVEKIIELA